jgi:hypothetical protein
MLPANYATIPEQVSRGRLDLARARFGDGGWCPPDAR